MKTYTLDHNGNPRPEAWREIASTLRRALERYPKIKLNMGEGRVQDSGHPCGTTHCFAGAFLLGAKSPEWIEKKEALIFTEGVPLILNTLGFKDNYDLKFWANDNVLIWGNPRGWYLFADEGAFSGAKNISEIADFLEGVADRQEQFNKKEVSA